MSDKLGQACPCTHVGLHVGLESTTQLASNLKNNSRTAKSSVNVLINKHPRGGIIVSGDEASESDFARHDTPSPRTKLAVPERARTKRKRKQTKHTGKTGGIKTGGNKTGGNKTDGNKTDGNKTDGNKTAGACTPETSKTVKLRRNRAKFVVKLFALLQRREHSEIISWHGADRSSFVIWQRKAFSNVVLPGLFSHSNFASFERQMNFYSFSKMSLDADLPSKKRVKKNTPSKWMHRLFHGQASLEQIQSIRRTTAPDQSRELRETYRLAVKKQRAIAQQVAALTAEVDELHKQLMHQPLNFESDGLPPQPSSDWVPCELDSALAKSAATGHKHPQDLDSFSIQWMDLDEQLQLYLVENDVL